MDRTWTASKRPVLSAPWRTGRLVQRPPLPGQTAHLALYQRECPMTARRSCHARHLSFCCVCLHAKCFLLGPGVLLCFECTALRVVWVYPLTSRGSIPVHTPGLWFRTMVAPPPPLAQPSARFHCLTCTPSEACLSMKHTVIYPSEMDMILAPLGGSGGR